MEEQIDGVRAKLARAATHLGALDAAISAYLADNPFRFVGEEHTAGEYHHWAVFLEVDRFPPDTLWGPMIGDAVHNLRSALDHLAWGVAHPSVRAETPSRIEFPVLLMDPASDPKIRKTYKRKLDCLRTEAHPTITAVQPYKSGDSHHPLWLLHRLWNTDKHRTLHTAGFMFGTPSSADATFGYDGWSFGRFGREGEGKNRSPLARGHGLTYQGVEKRLEAYRGMAFDVALGQSDQWPSADTSYEGLPIRQVLRRIEAYVRDEIVAPLTPLVQGNKAGISITEARSRQELSR